MFNSYAQRELLKEGVEEKGITVESSEIDEQIDKVKANYDTDEKWQAALDQAGMTEDSYRAEIEQKLKENKLYASFASDEDPQRCRHAAVRPDVRDRVRRFQAFLSYPVQFR